MKNFGHSINIDHDSNYIIGHSEVDYSSARIGSLINIDNDGHFYIIGAVEPLNLILNFSIDGNNIIVNGNYENYFLLDDVLTISYKEHEMLIIDSILNNGVNYKAGDVLSLNGGILSTNTIDNTSQSTNFKVDDVDIKGTIKKLTPISKGKYIKFPDKTNNLIGGRGSGAQISVESALVSNRKMFERQVISATNQDSNTIIELNFKLPPAIQEGKVSINKYKIFLTSTYVGPTKKNVNYNIVRDYSPILQLPLLVKGSNKLEEIANHNILRLEQKIKELEDKINRINSLIKI